MTAFIVDTSIAAVWFLPDEEHELAEAAMDRLIRENAAAPDILPHEIRSVLLIAERRRRIASHDVQTSLARLRQMPVRIVSGGDDVLVVRLARQYQLSAYDAAYLALAFAESVPLATLDKKLRQAAASEGVPLFAP